MMRISRSAECQKQKEKCLQGYEETPERGGKTGGTDCLIFFVPSVQKEWVPITLLLIKPGVSNFLAI